MTIDAKVQEATRELVERMRLLRDQQEQDHEHGDDDMNFVDHDDDKPPAPPKEDEDPPPDNDLPEFGVIVHPKDKQQFAFYFKWPGWELPDKLLDFIDETFGEAHAETPTARIWRLKNRRQAYDDEYTWLAHAIEWHAATVLRIDIEVRTMLIIGNIDEAEDGPRLDFDGKDNPVKRLVQAYRAFKLEGNKASRGKPELSKKFQRVMENTWNVFEESDLSPAARLILLAILKDCWSNRSAKIKQGYLCKRVGCSPRSLRSAISELTEAKILRVDSTYEETGTGKTRQIENTYVVLDKKMIPPWADHNKKNER